MKSLLTLLLILIALGTQAQVTSTFDADADGWIFLNSATTVTPNHSLTGGNPAGFISVTYSSNVSTTTQNWIAPAKFRGNQLVKSYGMNLKFDLQQAPVSGTNSNGNGDVRIENGSNAIVYSLPAKPVLAPAWSSYTLKLDDTQGWRIGSTGGVLATKSQIQSVLVNITSIEIRGTYVTNASNTSGLDNVILEQRTLSPAPVANSLSVSSGKPGDVLTINGSGFDPAINNNSVYFGVLAGTKATIQSASATSLQVIVPQGAVYGPITITNHVTGLSTKSLTPFNPVFDGGGRIISASFKNRFAISTIPIEGWFVGDFDGDGWEDFAVANNNADDVIDIYRNLGLGGNLSAASFDAKVSVSIPQLGGSGTNGAGLWFADLDGDGLLDAVSSNSTSGINSAFITLRNISTPGSLAFEAPEYWAGASDETPINLITDLDGDGRPEILAGEGSGGSTSASFFWANQNISTPGNIEFGGLAFPLSAAVPNGFAGATSGDLNGDGKNELIISHNFGDQFTVLQNMSDPGVPSFLNSFTTVTGQYNRSMKVVDVNLDGKNDLIWKKSGGGVYIRLNTDSDGILTDTDFATEFILTSDLGADGGIGVVDFNGDGKPDIAITDSDAVGVFENIFSGGAFDVDAFIPAYQVFGANAGSSTGSPLASDLNHDGKPDLIIAGGSSITIVENKNVNGPAISVNTVTPLAAPVGSTVTITGNNFSTTLTDNEVYFGAVKATVLSATQTQLTVSVPPGASYAPVSVRKGELMSRYRLPFTTTFSPGVTFDNTHFAPPVNFTLTNANYDIEVGDLNRDGKPDVLAEGTGAYAFRNDHSSGAITTSSLIPDDTIAGSFLNPRLEDFDGDGYPDVASVNGLANRNISTLTEIAFEPSISLGLGGSTMDQADFNNDGKIDFAITVDLSGAGDLVVRENRSSVGSFTTGTFSSFSTNIVFNKPAANGGIVNEDFDGDGFADIATTNPLSDNVSVYHNAGLLKISNSQFDSRLDLAVGDSPGRIYKGDFDADGKVDLMLYHNGTSTTLLTVFHNTSTVGNLSFTRIDLTNPSATTVATIADLDGDGKPEIITTSEAGNRFSIFKNIHTNGALTNASFAAPFNTTVTAPRGIATGDLNLDGKPEIIITRAVGLLVVYENLIPAASLAITQQPASSTSICQGNLVTFTAIATGTSNITYQWQSQQTDFTFSDIIDGGAYSGTNTSTLTVDTGIGTVSLAYRCRINGDFASEKISSSANLLTLVAPFAPSTTGASGCSPSSLTLSASGGVDGEYRWYTTATGGTPIAGEINSTYTTPPLTSSVTYYVSRMLACESARTPATATINTTPAKPTITSSITPSNGNISVCSSSTLTLLAPSGFNSYLWSNGEITQQITVISSGNYSVRVEGSNSCLSPSSDALNVTVIPAPCANQSPVINTFQTTSPISGSVSIDLVSLVSDADNNLDLASLKIISQPISGAQASIINSQLIIDYAGLSFTGPDKLTIEVCDLLGSCTQQEITIEVVGDLVVYNGISPNGDMKNDVWLIQNIEVLPDTRENKVSIFNRWGDLVFEVSNYDNNTKVFTGINKNGNELPSGVYFYKIEFSSGRKTLTGNLALKK